MSAKKGLEFIHVELKRDTWMGHGLDSGTENGKNKLLKLIMHTGA